MNGARSCLRGRVGDGIDIGGRVLVGFDGCCGFCNWWVRWLLKRDRHDRMRFLALESEKMTGVLERQELYGLDEVAGTLVVVRNVGGVAERVLVRSDAVIALLKELPGWWNGVGGALGVVPRPIRDLGYRLVARWRYRIWGRLEVCPVPTAEERGKFI
jgi:predicted DCC family thiol-disulfide oxidoreductase YuxK